MQAAIIHYGVGNINHLYKYFETFGFKTKIINSAKNLSNYDLLILPGVGSYTSAMNFLNKNKLTDQIQMHDKLGKKIIGICLGFQLLGSFSMENNVKTQGLGFFKLNFMRLNTLDGYVSQKIPHIGWNIPIGHNCSFYYLHAYASQFKNQSGYDKIEYVNYDGVKFVSMIEHSNKLGVQFHPEMSGGNFDLYLSNFLQK